MAERKERKSQEDDLSTAAAKIVRARNEPQNVAQWSEEERDFEHVRKHLLAQQIRDSGRVEVRRSFSPAPVRALAMRDTSPPLEDSEEDVPRGVFHERDFSPVRAKVREVSPPPVVTRGGRGRLARAERKH